MTETAESSTSRQPQALPLPWVDRIFARMEGLYGNLFLDRWRDCDAANVRQTWALELGGFAGQPEVIAGALKALSERTFPPTLPEFLALCREAAKRLRSNATPRALLSTPLLTDEQRDAAAEKLRTALSKGPGYDCRAWARALRRDYLAGIHLNGAQIAAASGALCEVWENRQCHEAMQVAA